MGVYIKGMEMPTGERPIHIEIHRDGTVLQWKFNESDEIIGTAVEVPPHGKLIDADKLHKATYHRAFETDGDTMWQSDCWVRYRAIEQVQDSQPTIIEAEGKE